jgi:RNA ligase
MTDFEKTTYNNLTSLIKTDDSFYEKSFSIGDNNYKIFNYRLANWSSFQKPSAKNARGIMFDVTDENNPIIVSLPPEKFFNYEEDTIDHTIGKIKDKMCKMDGSLISTYLHNGELFLKSKTDISSTQALESMQLLEKKPALKNQIQDLVKKGYTVNMEYTSPKNRIVLLYPNDSLTILSIRNNKTGETFFASRLEEFIKTNSYNEIYNNLVHYETNKNNEINHEEFIEQIKNETTGEGYVVEIDHQEHGIYLVKIKTTKYLALHKTKDDVYNSKRLFEAIINEASDDLKAMFKDDPTTIEIINNMEETVLPIYNKIIKKTEQFVEDHHNLSRKDFAIKAKQEEPLLMPLLMNMYLNKQIIKNNENIPLKEVNYKEFAIKNQKTIFNIQESEKLPEEEKQQKITPF